MTNAANFDSHVVPVLLLGTLAALIPVRILAVCDVYDALISTRVYRDAWTHERAIKLLRDESGTSFDAKCVNALERVLASERAPVAAAV